MSNPMNEPIRLPPGSCRPLTAEECIREAMMAESKAEQCYEGPTRNHYLREAAGWTRLANERSNKE